MEQNPPAIENAWGLTALSWSLNSAKVYSVDMKLIETRYVFSAKLYSLQGRQKPSYVLSVYQKLHAKTGMEAQLEGVTSTYV